LVWQLEIGEHAEFIGFDNWRDQWRSPRYMCTQYTLVLNDVLIDLLSTRSTTYIRASHFIYADIIYANMLLNSIQLVLHG
jgi:hypothetical protein